MTSGGPAHVWSNMDLVAVLRQGPAVGSDLEISLDLFDADANIGVGLDNQGRGVLILPGQPDGLGFNTSALEFDPICRVARLEAGDALPPSAILRCRFDRTDDSLLQIVAGLMVSLIDHQHRFGESANAIDAIRQMFSEGFRASPPTSVVTGLIGEMVVLLASSASSQLVASWHADPNDRYDFAAGSKRLEVKTTAGVLRQHHFSSRQLPPVDGIQLWVASVRIAEVPLGSAPADLFKTLLERLEPEAQKRVAKIIIDTVRLPPGALSSPRIDLDSAIKSIRLYEASDVPTPTAVSGVTELSWTALVREDHGRAPSSEELAQLLD